eukprot:scaffold13889_cov68-Phaeocystis_antarctica.AAC.2
MTLDSARSGARGFAFFGSYCTHAAFSLKNRAIHPSYMFCLPSSCVCRGAHLASSTTASALARVPRAPFHGAG